MSERSCDQKSDWLLFTNVTVESCFCRQFLHRCPCCMTMRGTRTVTGVDLGEWAGAPARADRLRAQEAEGPCCQLVTVLGCSARW